MPNSPPSLYSASTSCSAAAHNESGTLEIEGAEGQIRQEDSGFLSCWEEGGEKVSMANFALIRVLGKGAYGKVFLVRKIGGQDNGRYYAMKVLKKTRVSQKQKTLEHTLAERKVLERLKGMPFLVNMIYAFQTDTKLHIVMGNQSKVYGLIPKLAEFVRGGELFTHLCKRKKFELSTARMILAEILIALDNVHKAGVIYRDLKLENILLDDEGHIKLTDFGLSKAFDDNLNATNSYCGTIEYMAPEIVRRTPEGYSTVVDWWSFGVIAFELLTGCSPFTVDGDANSTQDIARRILTKRVPFPKWLDPISREFIAGLLNKDPKLRLGSKDDATEVKKAKFFEGLNWLAMEKREFAGPVKPKIVGGFTDVENFAAEFTAQTPLFSPADPPPPECHQFFRGYSFVTPSVIFSNDNVIGQECLEKSVHLLTNQNSIFFTKYSLDTTAEGLLGRGSFSICRRCIRLSDGRKFAVKIVSQRFAHQAIREIRILEALNPHDHIVPMIEALSDQFHYYIILELLEGGELLQRLRRMEKFSELQAAEIMAQLVSAVKHMHQKDIVHRDLKPENILFESIDASNSRLRLVDFGFARILPPQRSGSSSAHAAKSLITPLCGTLHYAAPEVLEIEDELPQYNQQCDLWSLGVILYTLLSGKIPFQAKSQAESAVEIISRIKNADFSFADPIWAMISQPAKDLITSLLTVDPMRRLSLSQLSRHPWLRQVQTPESACVTELPTPTILPRSADETFNATISAFISASREGNQWYLRGKKVHQWYLRRDKKYQKRKGQKDPMIIYLAKIIKNELEKRLAQFCPPGFQLMDVQTAPLLVKRRGMKRQRDPEGIINDEKNEMENDGCQTFGTGRELCAVPEGTELLASETNNGGVGGKRRPTTLEVFGSDPFLLDRQKATITTPNSTAFTEYRDTKPPYLKYSRDDLGRTEMIGGETETDGETRSESDGAASSAGSTIRISNDSV